MGQISRSSLFITAACAVSLTACGAEPHPPVRPESEHPAPSDARLELVPAVGGTLPSTSPVAVSFVGSRSAIVRSFEILGVHGYAAGEPEVLELETLDADVTLARYRLAERPTSVLVVGDAVLLAYEGSVERRRFADGEVTREAALGGRLLAAAPDGRVLLAVRGGAVLLDRDLAPLAHLAIFGTASSVMRVYTGERGPTYHETWPVEVPAEVVSAAFGPDGVLALGTNDGAVHLVAGDIVQRVAIDVPARPPSDYPHVAEPLALRFVDAGTLHVAMAYGAIVAIDVAAATARELHPARCAPEEIEALLAPFVGDRRAWTVQTYCEDAGAAAFSADGARLATRASLGVRVRDVATGTSVRALLTNAPHGLAFREDAHLALLDVYGEREEISLVDGSVSRARENPGVQGEVAIYPDADLVLSSVALAPEPAPPGRDSSPRPARRVAAFHLDGTPYGFVRERLFVAASSASERIATYDALSGTVEVTDRAGHVIFSETGLGLAARYHALGVSPDGRTVLLASDGLVQRVDAAAVTELSSSAGVVETFGFGGGRVAFTRFVDAPWGYRLEVRALSGASLLDVPVRDDAVGFSPDGATVAYVLPSSSEERTVALRSLGESERLPLTLDSVSSLAVSGDTLLWSGLGSGLMRREGDGEPVPVGVGALGFSRLTFGASTFVMEDGAFGAHVIRQRDHVHLATIHALRDGFVVISRRGAIDGSANLASAFVTVARDGRVRAASLEAIPRTPGLLARVLAGEDVAP